MEITEGFKEKVVAAMKVARENYSGIDKAFAMMHGINPAVYSRVKGGDTEKVIANNQWLELGRKFDVSMNERKWKTARTDVFTVIEEDIMFCKAHAKSRICVDDCGIGKSYTAKYLSRTQKNVFYIDCSQAKTQQTFIRLMAKTIGVDAKGKLVDVKENVKYYLRQLTQPVVVIDEAGDLNYSAFLEMKEFWNATEGCCGWYMIGADGLRAKLERGINNKKVGFREIFSRFSENFTRVVPAGKDDRVAFYKKLLTDVLTVNCDNKDIVPQIVKRCLTSDGGGNIGGLRRAESLLILSE